MIEVHFIDVGQGNMVFLVFPDTTVMMYDCNITTENQQRVFKYLRSVMPKSYIDLFVNSHREADHMRGIKLLHKIYPISTLWDTGVSGNTCAPEYEEYMDFRRNQVKNIYEVSSGSYWSNKPYVRILNGKRTTGDINSQSVVLHINYNGASLLLAGDTDAKVWKDYIITEYLDSVQTEILYASHHGSVTFFDDPRDTEYYYTRHLQKINPAMTIISVGDNIHGHPDTKALEFYNKHTRGSHEGNKVFQTKTHGNMKLLLKNDGSWSLNHFQ